MNTKRNTKKRSKRGLSQTSRTIQSFARRLREWRQGRGLPLKHIAKELGVSISIISEWEHGHRFPSVANLEALGNYTGLPVCCLLYHGDGPCPHKDTSLQG